MTNQDFVHRVLTLIDQKTGHEVLPKQLLADFLAAGQPGRVELDRERVKTGLARAFAHLAGERHKVRVAATVPDIANLSGQKLCERVCRSLLAAVASAYSPEMPRPADWRTDRSLRRHLQCALAHFIGAIVPEMVEVTSSDKTEDGAINKLVDQLLEEHDTRMTMSQAAIMLSEPKILALVAEAAGKIVGEEACREFLEEVFFDLGQFETVPAKEEVAAIIANHERKAHGQGLN